MHSKQHVKDTGTQKINHTTSIQKRAIKITYTGKTQCKVQLRVRIIQTSEIKEIFLRKQCKTRVGTKP
jgi:hypothetical protein